MGGGVSFRDIFRFRGCGILNLFLCLMLVDFVDINVVYRSRCFFSMD